MIFAVNLKNMTTRNDVTFNTIPCNYFNLNTYYAIVLLIKPHIPIFRIYCISISIQNVLICITENEAQWCIA